METSLQKLSASRNRFAEKKLQVRQIIFRNEKISEINKNILNRNYSIF